MTRWTWRYHAPRRSVRLHLSGDAPSIEGVLVGRWRGQYVLEMPKAITGEGRTVSLEGYVEVDAKRVAFMQVIPPAAPDVPEMPWMSR